MRRGAECATPRGGGAQRRTSEKREKDRTRPAPPFRRRAGRGTPDAAGRRPPARGPRPQGRGPRGPARPRAPRSRQPARAGTRRGATGPRRRQREQRGRGEKRRDRDRERERQETTRETPPKQAPDGSPAPKPGPPGHLPTQRPRTSPLPEPGPQKMRPPQHFLRGGRRGRAAEHLPQVCSARRPGRAWTGRYNERTGGPIDALSQRPVRVSGRDRFRGRRSPRQASRAVAASSSPGPRRPARGGRLEA